MPVRLVIPVYDGFPKKFYLSNMFWELREGIAPEGKVEWEGRILTIDSTMIRVEDGYPICTAYMKPCYTSDQTSKDYIKLLEEKGWTRTES